MTAINDLISFCAFWNPLSANGSYTTYIVEIDIYNSVVIGHILN
jgi:hypothetical protein